MLKNDATERDRWYARQVGTIPDLMLSIITDYTHLVK